jgi:hypothetical protein
MNQTINQKNPLFIFRKESLDKSTISIEDINYNPKAGYWENSVSEPIINKALQNKVSIFGNTIETRTREGIDRSENTF